ncbi:MAG: hypothetical protein JNM48_09205 [Rhodospirillales bacterium]|nr:hypothetical protein [Rhodospirillales bacterium]
MKIIRIAALASAAPALLAGGLLLAACDEKGSAEKAGQEAGKKVDQAIEQTKQSMEKAKEGAAKLLDNASDNAKEAAEQVRQGSRDMVEEAERKIDEATKPAEKQ